MKTYYAFYSHEQAKLTGTHYYKTFDGREAEVTEVSEDPDYKPHFPDVVCWGEVVSWVRKGRPAPM